MRLGNVCSTLRATHWTFEPLELIREPSSVAIHRWHDENALARADYRTVTLLLVPSVTQLHLIAVLFVQCIDVTLSRHSRSQHHPPLSPSLFPPSVSLSSGGNSMRSPYVSNIAGPLSPLGSHWACISPVLINGRDKRWQRRSGELQRAQQLHAAKKCLH